MKDKRPGESSISRNRKMNNDPSMLQFHGHVTSDFHVEEDPLVTCASDTL
jgi:hypothetical protein